MSVWDQIATGLQNPMMLVDKLNREINKTISPVFRNPTMVFEEDWDNLIILDACRNDTIQRHSGDFSAPIETKWSAGSSSPEFLENNIEGRSLNDVVWVTANPWVSQHEESIYRVLNVWDEGWCDEKKTVLPDTMVKWALDAVESYPHKRLVIHFMQPHYPFIGESGNDLPTHRTFTGKSKIEDADAPSIWELLKRDEVEKPLVWQAYQENLSLAIPAAKKLVQQLNGKSVITADHGNAFGERALPIPFRLFGHDTGYRNRCLIEVPWIEFNSFDQRRTINEDVIKTGDNETTKAEDRLKQLGYL